MSKVAHLMCEKCLAWVDVGADDDMTLTETHNGRLCCWCGKRLVWSVLIHRHPVAVPCRGIHEKV